MTREQKLEKALTNLLNMYLEGANSGDWGNWNPEEDAEVIEAREALAQQPCAALQAEREGSGEGLRLIVAAALFDFGGWLTSRTERTVCSSTDNAAPMAEAIKAFCDMRGLNAGADLPVLSWQEAR